MLLVVLAIRTLHGYCADCEPELEKVVNCWIQMAVPVDELV